MSIRKKIVWLPYDFDTAIGINNEGALVFSYNLEDTDQLEGGANVFNGQQSVVWNNLRDAFGSELQAMYRSLRSEGVLSYDTVEQMFEEHQNKWPEAIFNEDSWFKYIDPLTEDGDGAYLDMLQGSKTEQRKWWLYNRFRYIDSKYNAGDALSDLIQIRGYAISNITVLPYADIYPTVKYGSYLVTARGHRLQETTLVCPLDEVNDTEIYIYSASQLASVGDLSGFKVGFANFAMATRLQEIKIGDSSSGYDNPNLASLTLGNNVLLRKIDVRNCSGLGDTTKAGHTQQAVDISGCSIVEEVYFDGTNITGLRLPNGGVLKKLHVPASMRNLTILNQTGITEFVIPSYSNISTLRLENVPTLNTKAILNAISASTRVRLIGFAWEVENAAEIEALLDKLDTMRGLDENDNEMAKAQVSGAIHTSSLTGSQIASYNARYPYLRVTADSITSVLTFATWDGGTIISTVTCINGVMQGNAPSVPSRSQSAQYTFTAVGWNREPDASANDPSALVDILADRTVYAAYSRVVRTYTVTFKNGNTVLQTINDVPYGGTATYTGETPAHPTAPADYTFTGFLPDGTNITGATDCIAQFIYAGIATRKIIDRTISGDYENTLAESVGDYAFTSCSKLTDVSLPLATSIGGSAFQNCIALTSISLPAATSIDINAFSGCSKLTDVSLPLATSIGGSAFLNCSALTSISLPAATSIGNNAFKNCIALTSISLPAATSIGTSAFTSCSKLTDVSLPLATSIGGSAFQHCIALTSISLPAATSIDINAFLGCSKLTDVSLPLATSISGNAFTSCSKLTDVSLPLATSIGDSAFSGCSALTSISLPAATSIDTNAFLGCSKLTDVSLPLATSIGGSAFSGCSALTSISLPAATSIGNNAFKNCIALTTVILGNTEQVATLGSTNTFSTAGNAIIYVPDALVNDYKAANRWSTYASRIKGISELPEEV